MYRNYTIEAVEQEQIAYRSRQAQHPGLTEREYLEAWHLQIWHVVLLAVTILAGVALVIGFMVL